MHLQSALYPSGFNDNCFPDIMVINPMFLSLRINVSTNQGSKSFKQKREEERKASEAGGDTKAWSSLFMRPDTVCFVEYITAFFFSFLTKLILGSFCILSEFKGCSSFCH